MLNYHSADRLLIIPPFFAFGIAISFLVPLWMIILVACVCVVCVGISRFLPSAFSVILWICVPILLGLGIGTSYYNLYYEHNPITHILKDITVTGKIISIQDNADKPRIILKIDAYEEQKLPQFVRLNMSKQEYQSLSPYDTITAKVFLAPPAKALFDGGYNFEFYAQLHSFGATGRIQKIIHHIPAQNFSLSSAIHSIRLKIADNILKTLPIDTASPIIAMITGSRFDIPEPIQQAWKSSGIYHLLSISGLHMTIIAGICFAIIRHLLLLIPALAYGGKVKKITAMCVMPLAYGYVLLSGGDVPVMRAYIMVCVGLMALLCNQRMITLRSACVAFCCVLVLNPIDIFNIGFALSFAAVFGIIIAVNLIDFLKKHYSLSKITHFMLVNVCAGYAGLPLALYIFNSNALLGLFTNMIAIPLTSIVIMPLMVLSIAVMIFDLETYPLIITGWGIDILNHVSLYIADLPYAILYQQSPLLIWIILFYTSIYMLAINTKQSIKIGLCLVVVSIIGHSISPKHDYLVLKTEHMIFYINKNNQLIQLVQYDKSYFNPYLKEQVLLHFGRNPQSIFYYEKCRYHKTYVTLSGFEFKCK